MIKNLIVVISLFVIATSVQAVEHLRIATTTSTDNSGLFTVLHPTFEQKFDAKVDVIAFGTGKALKIGSNGDVDVVFVHAPAAELKYVKQGAFIDRKPVMHNDFVIIGPKSDSAGITQAQSASQALQLIAKKKVTFISRGDNSGTHKKEQALWAVANIKPEGVWYLQVGQGMGAVLTIANEKQAYTLTDRGTQIAFNDKSSLEIIYQGDDILFNPYHVMAVNPDVHDHVNYELAVKYIDFVTSEEGQKIINNFRKSGEQLFYPDANQP